MSFVSAFLTWLMCMGAPAVDCNAQLDTAACHTPVPTSGPVEEPQDGWLPWGVIADISNGF